MVVSPHTINVMRATKATAILLLVLVPALLTAQTREQIKAEAQSAVQRMTPAEIDQKLKELGMTREEAASRAKEYGISVDDFLNRISPVSTPAETSADFGGTGQRLMTGDPRLESGYGLKLRPSDLDFAGQKKIGENAEPLRPVPGFDGRSGIDTTIRPYGMDIFKYPSTFFSPSASAAPPPSYVLGPGDELTITLWGETRLSITGVVTRQGTIAISDIGPVPAGGLSVEQFRDRLLKRLSSVYSSLQGGSRARTFLDVSLGKLRNIQVFVAGDVMHPGGYAIPSTSTALTAMYAAGGPTITGSLRSVQVVRGSMKVPALDLYRYLLAQEESANVLLMDGDVLFVPPATHRAAIVGEVGRPAIYELVKGETLGNLIAMAGGLRFTASTKRVEVERIVPFADRGKYDRDILQVGFSFAVVDSLQQSRERIEDGDVVRIFPIIGLPLNRVTIIGQVNKPGMYSLRPGMRVADLVMRADSLQRNTFAERGTLSRILPNLRREVYSFNLQAALAGDEAENLLLMNEDSVNVYTETMFYPERTVTIAGAVRNPGAYPRRDKMTIGDLIVMAGGLTDLAELSAVEVGRMDTTSLGTYAKVHKVDLPRNYWKRSTDDFLLQDRDVVSIPDNPKVTLPRSVKITGFVMYPGTYSIRNANERMADVFKRAGGLRAGAYLEGSRLYRKERGAGLVPLDFAKALRDESSRDNVVMYDGDSIAVAETQDVVYVSGEVIVPSPVLYKKGASLSYYVDQAGGAKQEADEGRIVVLLPGGKKWDSGGIFGGDEILPGSSVYVPRKIEKEDKTLPIIRDLATILASLAALTVAVVQVTK